MAGLSALASTAKFRFKCKAISALLAPQISLPLVSGGWKFEHERTACFRNAVQFERARKIPVALAVAHELNFNSCTLIKISRQRYAEARTLQQFLVCGSTCRRRPVLLASSRLASKNEFMSYTWSSRFCQLVAFSWQAFRRLRPNPSLKGSTNGGPRGPGQRYAVHFR